MHNLFGLIFLLSSVIFYKPEVIDYPPYPTREDIKNLHIKSKTEYKISEGWRISEKKRLQTEKVSDDEYDISGNMISQRFFDGHEDFDFVINQFDSIGNNIESKLFTKSMSALY